MPFNIIMISFIWDKIKKCGVLGESLEPVLLPNELFLTTQMSHSVDSSAMLNYEFDWGFWLMT